uniref:Uncharacterized protein n=1 Tax=Salix viminalis TaxID=40686 RepID=A0A6N2LBW3_SALVM
MRRINHPSFVTFIAREMRGRLEGQFILLEVFNAVREEKAALSIGMDEEGHTVSILKLICDNVYYLDKKIWSGMYNGDTAEEINVKIAVELTSKKNFYTYMGNILHYMSIVDLSCNRFIGEIPIE